MNFKKIGLALLFPHIAIMIILLPIATALLIYSMVFVGTESIIAYVSYAVAAYTLTVWCFKIPYLINFFKTFKNENKYVRMWLDDERLRVNVSLYTSLAVNTAFAVLQLGLGFTHSSFWFHSLAGYYISLAVMKFFLVRYTAKANNGDSIRAELVRYRACGIIFLVMNLAISLMIFFMVYFDRTFIHHEITTIAIAAFTFTSMTLAVIGMVKHRDNDSPVYSALRAINLASACVSMLTLEATMLTTFGTDTMDSFTRKMLLGLSGGAVSVVIVFMAIYIIVKSTKRLHQQKVD